MSVKKEMDERIPEKAKKTKKEGNEGLEQVDEKRKPERKPNRAPTKANLLKELERKNAEIERLTDQLLRKAAEFENYKKRKEREVLNTIENAQMDVIIDILPVLDDFERSLKVNPQNSEEDSFYQGVALIYQKLKSALENRGLKPIEAVGEVFDPEKHEALMQKEVKDQPPNIVLEEHVKGYLWNDRIIRHAKVVVSK